MEPGRSIAHYELLEKLGEGGMGVVYKARDTKLDRTVALKFLPSHLSLDDEAKRRFVQEARAASALDHANICTIHDIAETADGEIYIVMAHYEGQTLGYRIRDEDFPLARCVDVGIQLARALERAHEAGIIHRDLKPANVLVTDRDEVKLLDFGIAKLSSSRQDLTRTGATLGTAGYMSPEQLDGREINARADLFAFGAVLYEMLAGRKAFAGETPMASAVAVLHATPTPLSELRPDVPEAVRSVVEACLAKDPEDRPASARVVLDGLERAAMPAGVPGSPPPHAGMATPAGPAGHRLAPGGARNRFRPVLIGVGVLATVGVVAASLLTRPNGTAEGGDPDLLAVLPFAVGGSPDLAYLGEGIVDLMSAKLNGAGSIATVNPRAVIARFNAEGGDAKDPDTPRRVAAAMGAGRYVTGEVLEVAGRITLTAYLHGTEREGAPPERASVVGSTEGLFDLLDELVADLLAGSMAGDTERLGRLATLTTASLPAAKAYLQGEGFMRSGLYREAAEAYDQAVALDSTFALAYYRKSIVADLLDAYDVRSSADRAYALSEGLAPRDRNLLRALHLRRNGRVAEAEQLFRAVVHDHPDDVEAWVQLGEAIFHDGARSGASTLEAIAPFRRAIDLEPDNLIARVHTARLYALFDSLDALAREAAYFAEHAPDSERAIEVEAMYAYLAGDTARQAALEERIVGQPWYYHFYAVHSVSRFARDVHGAAGILSMVPAEDPYVMALVPGIALTRGRYGEVRDYLAYLRSLDNPMWDVFEAFVLSSGTYPVDSERAASLAARLAAEDPAVILRSSFIPPYEDLTVAVSAFQRDYYVALLRVDLGRTAEARALLEEMKEREDFVGLGSFKRDVERSLEAELLLAEGDRAGALALLREMDLEVPHAVTVWPIGDLGRARFQLAELELELGDRDAAKRLYVGMDEPWSPWDSYWRPLVYERLGQIAESEGDVEEAIRHYGRLVELWRACDPEVVPRRDEIQARLDALRPAAA